MKFAFDIDDVIFRSYDLIAEFLEKEYGIPYTEPETFDLLGKLKFNSTEIRYIIDKSLSQIDKFIPIEGSIDFLKTYHCVTGDSINLITSRHESLVQSTYDLFDKWLGDTPYTVKFPITEGKTKADSAIEMGVDVFVEDRVKYSIQVSDAGALVLMMRRSWNSRFVDPLCSHRIIQIDNWKDVDLIFRTFLHCGVKYGV